MNSDGNEQALVRLVQQLEEKTPNWDDAHCASAFGDYVLALKGKDPMKQWRRIKGKRRCMAIVRRHGNMTGLVTAAMGSIGLMEKIGLPERGDLVTVDLGEIHAVGVYLGGFTIVKSEAGAFRLKFTKFERVWSCS